MLMYRLIENPQINISKTHQQKIWILNLKITLETEEKKVSELWSEKILRLVVICGLFKDVDSSAI